MNRYASYRFKAHHDPEFDTGAVARGAACVCIRFSDGTEEQCFKRVSSGIAMPLPGDEVVTKFRTLIKELRMPDASPGSKTVFSISKGFST